MVGLLADLWFPDPEAAIHHYRWVTYTRAEEPLGAQTWARARLRELGADPHPAIPPEPLPAAVARARALTDEAYLLLNVPGGPTAEQTAGALASMREVLELRPDWPRGQLGFAAWLCQAGAVDDALNTYARVLRPTREYATGYVARAQLRAGEATPAAREAALADTEQAIALDPRFVKSALRRVLFLLDWGRTAEAEADLDRLTVTHAYSHHPFQLRGELRLARGDHAGAQADFDAAIERAPGRAAELRARAAAVRARAAELKRSH